MRPTVLYVFGVVLSEHLQKAWHLEQKLSSHELVPQGWWLGGWESIAEGGDVGEVLEEGTRRPVGSCRKAGSGPSIVLSACASVERSHLLRAW